MKRQTYTDYSFSSLMVIFPFFAVFTTFRALLITPMPNRDNSAADIVSSFGLLDFRDFVFMNHNK